FRPHRSAGQPSSASQNCVRKMVVEHKTAVGDRKQKSLAKVKAGVPTHGKPKIPGSPKRERKHQAGNRYIGRSHDAFARVSQVRGPKHERETHGSGPERSEEHTSELQSLAYLVCRLLLEKK